MMAVRLFEHGGPEVLKYLEVPIPEVGPDEVLMRVRATAVNSWDLRYRAGNLPQPLPGRPPWPLPFQLGRDAAGEIVATGENVTRWRPGDRAVQLPHPPCRNCPCAYAGSKTSASTRSTPVTRSSGDTPSTSYVARTRCCPSPTVSSSRGPRPPCGPTQRR
ncbi:alcohol dehydrogenase catalytic domain-containing protein [Streptomyces sp. NPDC047043]|uniref:alcohol dehydrogenase catalytic domain-containing protein n=1 Tax=Streptomyces sp. NPDC047043 TaxID=3154497 RepID=UPI0033E5D596